MNSITIYELYYHDNYGEKVNYGNGTITEVIGMVEQWFYETEHDIELKDDGEFETLETLKYFFKNPTEWVDRRKELNGSWDWEFWNDFYIDEIYTMNLSEIENDLVELCEDNDIMKDVIKDYFKKEVTSE
tara:strand:+ start:415 stop:804 length:390 start_codon:yes stop_codon:yes gene_type:complete